MELLKALVQQMEVNTKCSPNDYVGENGLMYCGKCNTPKQIFMFDMKLPVVCKCKKAELEEEERRVELIEKQEQMERLRSASLLGEKYKNARFDNTETSHSKEFKVIYDRCKKYCEVSQEVLEKSIGIYLFGTKGTGKSRITACMANELMDKYHSVLYTNFSEISKHIRETFNKSGETEQGFLEKLAKIEFLFIDDFGTERVMKNNEDAWLQEKVFDVINKRYNSNKPIIFTSNYSLQELVRDRGMADKTVDRIMEMCEVMKLEGQSYRVTAMRNRERLF